MYAILHTLAQILKKSSLPKPSRNRDFFQGNKKGPQFVESRIFCCVCCYRAIYKITLIMTAAVQSLQYKL
ncbi:MAG: hypothetical protein UV92_C0012G0018 [Parcubacteria group bacterium GW2011_GWA1_43_27]|nr:MAG: hypothetical protein UV47_C0025G0009 [Parcubacteria group bacterium GW2011_GWA2_42_80]KKS91973.1 MAG: hypothetical protein UV69_C0041G0010 [Parcubacteria group bacterium GW2011_GWE2_43_12]KKT13920.1 MAG: hypothetical protein UV92_C0012G0018 [Parcubacteria group bacterium GW2011_GWA1_43_27]